MDMDTDELYECSLLNGISNYNFNLIFKQDNNGK